MLLLAQLLGLGAFGGKDVVEGGLHVLAGAGDGRVDIDIDIGEQLRFVVVGLQLLDKAAARIQAATDR